MEVIVRGQHFEVPDHIEERARTKLSKLTHYLPALEDALVEVDLTHEKAKDPDRRFLVRVIVSGHGVHLQAEEHAKEPETAVDAVAHVVTRQAERYKERLYSRSRNQRGAKALPVEPVEEGESGPKVARVKRFAVKPMSTSEAVEQMELLGHDFFLFRDADAEAIAVLYRRRGGDYGVIIPELT
jgi:putative sigma-54 modulation protein